MERVPAMNNVPKVKLYEISAMVCYHTVIAATSKEDAMKHIDAWESAWHHYANLISVGELELVDEREIKESISRESHDVTRAAKQAYTLQELENQILAEQKELEHFKKKKGL